MSREKVKIVAERLTTNYIAVPAATRGEKEKEMLKTNSKAVRERIQNFINTC